MQAGVLVGLDNRVNATESISIGSTFGHVSSDEDLLRLCAAGEQAALRELARRYQGSLFRFLARMMGSEEDAEEAVLDVFVRAWRNAPRFQFRARVATWLYRIAVNIARDAYSRKKVRPREIWLEAHEVNYLSVASAEEDAMHRLRLTDQSVALRRAMQRLSADDRLILVLYYLEDREYEEIQAITGLSYTVLKTRLARARRRLRTRMEVEINEAEQ